MKKIIIGIIIGALSMFILGGIFSYLDPGTLLEYPKQFGDLTIWAEEPQLNKVEERTLDVSEMLYISKTRKVFLSIRMDDKGKIHSFSLLNKDNKVILTMSSSTDNGKWERLIYCGYDELGRESGEMYVDTNFDGHFDLKKIFDNNNEITKGYIYLGDKWLGVEQCTPTSAKRGLTTYSFDIEIGAWRKNDY